MSWDYVRMAFQEEGLKPGEKLVLLVMTDCRNKRTKLCCPSVRYIAKRTGYCPRQVKRHLKSLRAKKLIFVKKKQGQHGYDYNMYTFKWDKKNVRKLVNRKPRQPQRMREVDFDEL